MKKFGRVLLTIFKVLVLLWILFLLTYLTMALFNHNIDNLFITQKGNYGKNPTWLSDSNSKDADEIYAKLDTETDTEIAYRLYELACQKMMLSKAYGVRAVSNIGAEALGYTIDVASNRTEQYYVPGTPVLNANQKVFSSYTNSIYVLHVSDDALGGILKAAVMFADRGYADGENSYKQKGSLERMDESDAGEEKITWSTDYEIVDTTGDRVYEDDEIRGKSNFIVSRTTILPESVEINREYSEEEGAYVYDVHFDLDCTGKGKDNAAYYEVRGLKQVLGSNLKSVVYTYLHVDFKMYSNGYMTEWKTGQEWEINYVVAFFNLKGVATIEKSETISYDPSECAVVDFTK